MSKMLSTFGSAAIVATLAFAPAPLAAQNARVSEVIVYGTDPCPRSTDDEVVVCARKPETERFRIPERLRQGGSLQSRQAWAVRAKSFETVGRTGINSCSAVGPAGHTGCLDQLIDEAFAERREQAETESTPR